MNENGAQMSYIRTADSNNTMNNDLKANKANKCHYFKAYFLYIRNHTEIVFHMVCNMAQYEKFSNLTPKWCHITKFDTSIFKLQNLNKHVLNDII